VSSIKIAAVVSLGVVVLMGVAFGQEGHPLVGTWSGDWGPTPTHRNQVTIVMNWDGKNVVGIINPGPDVIPMKVVTLDSTKWTVHIEADARDQSGNPVHFTIDGKLDNILSYKRTLTGTWSHGNVKGDFKVTRD
jgi:hypothetical protein